MQVIDRRLSQFFETSTSEAQEAAKRGGEENGGTAPGDGQGLFFLPILEGSGSWLSD